MRKFGLALLVFLIVAVFAANAEISTDTVREWVELGLGEGETITNLELEDKTFSVTVDLSGVKELYPGYITDLATDRASSITDQLLEHEEFDDEWEIMYLKFENVGYFFFTKDDIEVNDYDMRYIDVYDENYNSLINTDGT